MGLEVVGSLELLPQDPMVVDFAIDCKRDGAIIVDQGLSSTVLCSVSSSQV